jgi:hypothetical protein
MKARRKIQEKVKTCGECKDARESLKYRTIQTKEYFCMICPVTGLLKMKKWKCDIEKINTNQLKSKNYEH